MTQFSGLRFFISTVTVNIYVHILGKLWTRSQKLAYTLLNKLSTRNEPLLMPGDRVSLMMNCILQTTFSDCSARIS